jgi:hypothetical protein
VSKRVETLEDDQQVNIFNLKVLGSEVKSIKDFNQKLRLTMNNTLEDIDNLRKETYILNDRMNQNYANCSYTFKELNEAVKKNWDGIHKKMDTYQQQNLSAIDETRTATCGLIQMTETHDRQIQDLLKDKHSPQNCNNTCNVAQNQGAGGMNLNFGSLSLKPNMPATPDAMLKSGIYFAGPERFHPHHFLEKFEKYVNAIGVTQLHKCALLCQLVSGPGAESWKTDKVAEDNYANLKASFLREFWSLSAQNESIQEFKNGELEAQTTNEFIYLIRKWIGTIKTTDCPNMKDIINTAYHKLPYNLHIQVSKPDRESEEAFLSRLADFEDSNANSKIRRGRIRDQVSDIKSQPTSKIPQPKTYSDAAKSTQNPGQKIPFSKPAGAKGPQVNQVNQATDGQEPDPPPDSNTNSGEGERIPQESQTQNSEN